MMHPVSSLCVLILSAALATQSAGASFEPVPLSGQTFIHDPSTIVQDDGRYYLFGTGPGIRPKSSPDLIHWENGNSIFRTTPAWITSFVPTFKDYVWAPDVIRVNGKFLLYYSCSTWQKQISVIGLATSPTLDATATNYLWRDCGPVIASTNGAAFNTIDPSVFLEADGKLWLAFGSYWKGIYLMELDPQTGLRVSTNSPLHQLAWNRSIEAACLTRHENFYYLFVNWGQCCQGTNSTYEVRVGRADKITGPYRDRDGHDLATGGGSPFLQSHGRFIGPGHIGIVDSGCDASLQNGGTTPTSQNPNTQPPATATRASQPRTNGVTQFSYHYYDAATAGKSRLALGKIDWSDGWPVAVNAPANDWKLVWSDEFGTNGAPDPANWNYEHGFVRNHELQWYQPENAFCTNGLLVIEARSEHKLNPGFTAGSGNWKKSREWIDYTAASLTSRRLREFTYGKFEMRARVDTRLGSWPAFWTLGATPGIPWPACGEVDIMEYYTGDVLANIGYGLGGKIKWSSVKTPLTELGGEAWAREFHTWTMIWDENKIELQLDGKRMNQLEVAAADHADRGNPFHRPVYIILNQAIGGYNGGDPSQTKFPIRFEVDWVRVYQHAN